MPNICFHFDPKAERVFESKEEDKTHVSERPRHSFSIQKKKLKHIFVSVPGTLMEACQIHLQTLGTDQ